MGLFDKILRGADKVYDAKTDIEYRLFRDRRYDAAERLAAVGDAGVAIVTGIRGRLNDSTTEMVFRLEWNDGKPRESAIRFGGRPPAVLRLGASVRVRTDDGKAVLDFDAMPGVAPATADPGRVNRSVPDVGVDDHALDSRVKSRLKKWTSERGTISGWEATTAFGMPTENWNITVTRADGSVASTSKDNVPVYARWFVHPGSEVPIVVDPDDPAKMQIDWPSLAEERAGGSWKDAPPEGSILAVARAQTAQAAAAAAPPMSTGEEVSFAPPAGSSDAIEGVTIAQWALVEASLTRSRVPPGDYDAYATEHHGVPAGRWNAIAAAWNARVREDWRVGAAFGEAYEAAMKDLKKKRR